MINSKLIILLIIPLFGVIYAFNSYTKEQQFADLKSVEKLENYSGVDKRDSIVEVSNTPIMLDEDINNVNKTDNNRLDEESSFVNKVLSEEEEALILLSGKTVVTNNLPFIERELVEPKDIRKSTLSNETPIKDIDVTFIEKIISDGDWTLTEAHKTQSDQNNKSLDQEVLSMEEIDMFVEAEISKLDSAYKERINSSSQKQAGDDFNLPMDLDLLELGK